MAALPVNSRICARLADNEVDKVAFMQGLCDQLAAHLRAKGAAGGEIEDVLWLRANDDCPREGAVVIARPGPDGFEGMNADRCREIIAEKIAAAKAERAEVAEEGQLL